MGHVPRPLPVPDADNADYWTAVVEALPEDQRECVRALADLPPHYIVAYDDGMNGRPITVAELDQEVRYGHYCPGTILHLLAHQGLLRPTAEEVS